MTSPPPEGDGVELAVRLTPDTEHLATVLQVIGEHLTAAGESFTACATKLFELIDNPKT